MKDTLCSSVLPLKSAQESFLRSEEELGPFARDERRDWEGVETGVIGVLGTGLSRGVERWDEDGERGSTGTASPPKASAGSEEEEDAVQSSTCTATGETRRSKRVVDVAVDELGVAGSSGGDGGSADVDFEVEQSSTWTAIGDKDERDSGVVVGCSSELEKDAERGLRPDRGSS